MPTSVGVIFHNIAAAAVLMMLTVFIHSVALWGMRRRLERTLKRRDYGKHILEEAIVLALIVTTLCLIHFMEIMVWAAGYTVIGAIDNAWDAIYFSTATYTTVGADGVSAAPRFRNLAGLESLVGPMMVAWSTAFLVEYVGRMRAPLT